MRGDIAFMSKGLRCRGWLYMPDGLAESKKAPAIITAHGSAGIEEIILPDFAERFVHAGFVAYYVQRYLSYSMIVLH